VRSVQAQALGGSPSELGESPLWDDRTGQLYWIDITGHNLHRLDPLGSVTTMKLTQMVTTIGLTTGHQLVNTHRTGFALIDPTTGEVSELGPQLTVAAGERMNDGACDPTGQFWAGSAGETGTASLWRLDTTGHTHRMLDGVTESNGITWPGLSPTEFYYVDTPTGRVDVITMSAGKVDTRCCIADFPAAQGTPDGIAVDAEGNIWVALWGAGRVVCVSPDGAIQAEVLVGVPNVSNVAFFQNRNRWRMAITTAREDLDDDAVTSDGRHGALFIADSPVPGRINPRFTISLPLAALRRN